MSRELQMALALFVSFFGLFILWYLPDYKGALASLVIVIAAAVIYSRTQKA